MEPEQQTTYTAFAGARRIASGTLEQVVIETKQVMDQGTPDPVLIFDDTTSRQVEVDFRGTIEEVLGRLAKTTNDTPEPARPSGPGRPKLGVVAREVTLLPRHWAWLNSQPGGASVALRKLVDAARRANEGADRLRQAQESAYRFMSVMAGDLPGYEEAIRALYARHREHFETLIAAWPEDIRAHIERLVVDVFSEFDSDAS